MAWTIFLIGPMGQPDSLDRSDSDSHLELLAESIARVFKKFGYEEKGGSKYQLTSGETVDSTILKKGDDEVQVITPFDQYSPEAIPTRVFDAIDDCDLIIADLSGSRASVVYELAFAHALGIPTYLISENQAEIFYLKSYDHNYIDFSNQSAVQQALSKYLKWWLVHRTEKQDGDNPFTTFYDGVSLTDVSASLALAQGYFANFVVPALQIRTRIVVESGRRGILRRRQVRRFPISGLVIVDPGHLDAPWPQVSKDAEERLEKRFPGRVAKGNGENVYLETESSGRRIPFYILDNQWIIDIPRTIFSLAKSPRMRRIGTRSQGVERSRSMSTVLVRRFFSGVARDLRLSAVGDNNLGISGGATPPYTVVELSKLTDVLAEKLRETADREQ